MYFLAISLVSLSGVIHGFLSNPNSYSNSHLHPYPVTTFWGTDKFPKHSFQSNKTDFIPVIPPKNKHRPRHFHFSNHYFEEYIKRLNSKNISFRDSAILGNEEKEKPNWKPNGKRREIEKKKRQNKSVKQEFLELFQNISNTMSNQSNYFDYEIHVEYPEEDEEPDYDIPEIFVVSNQQTYPLKDPHTRNKSKLRGFQAFIPDTSGRGGGGGETQKKSENFEILDSYPVTFKDIGGYENIKQEMNQCIDILKNYTKYQAYNIRTPKGLILEGPPGNGKTLLAKGLAGEANASFIAVSGSEFQEKYVGVGASRVRELFELAKKNIPCVIFIDEIDAIGRKRSNEADASNSERDSTLNQLLVNMDGFQSTAGIFIIGATNRADLLDPALIRPGRIDKRIFIGLPDAVTREAILKIHIKGKPYDIESVNITDLVEITQGLSGSQLENLLNEAMLLAIRNNKAFFTMDDIERVMNRFIAGWQPNEHPFSDSILEKITIHEMGHAMVGLLSKHHSKMTKVVINLSSPQSPGYTIFESSMGGLYTREALFEHLMILLAGRIAEEVFYNVSVTTGAINDFEEALKLAEKMVVYYGMGRNLIYPSLSEKYKERIDNEVVHLIQDAYSISYFIVKNCKEMIKECATILQKDKILRSEHILEIAQEKYPAVLELHH